MASRYPKCVVVLTSLFACLLPDVAEQAKNTDGRKVGVSEAAFLIQLNSIFYIRHDAGTCRVKPTSTGFCIMGSAPSHGYTHRVRISRYLGKTLRFSDEQGA